LLVQAEHLKHTLSARHSGDIRVGSGGHTARYTVTRETFEDLTRDLLDRTELLARQVLTDAGFDWDQVDGVVPVGGSTRMPMVRARIESMSGRPPSGGAHPDQAVALGAALAAASESERVTAARLGSSGTAFPRLPGPRLQQDVIAHSLGMIAESADRTRYLNSVLIRKNLPIPAREQRPYQFRLHATGENVLEVFLTQGETEAPQDCAYLGRYCVTGFGPGDGLTVVDIGYEYDQNGVVHVSAVDRKTTRPLLVTIDAVPPDVPDRFLVPPADLIRREHATVYLAFDLSGSMAGIPLAESKRAAQAFVDQCDLSRTSVGLIGFSDRVRVRQRATQNAKEIGSAIQRLSAGETGYGNAAHPFGQLHHLMGDAPGARYAVVLADGRWSNQDLAVEQARKCHAAGIETIAIGFGTADRGFLERIASSSEQSLFTDLNRLTEAFSTIARELTEGTSGRIGGRTRQFQA
jgi:molecular chaperone DnaK